MDRFATAAPRPHSLAERVNLEKAWAFQGNHDYYSDELKWDDKLRVIAEEYGNHFGEKSDIRISGRRFLCCTLWSDMKLGGALADNSTEAEKVMNDDRHIRLAKRGYARARPIACFSTEAIERAFPQAHLSSAGIIPP